jgi:TetR/AcrR family transcriptional regulator of autoinduction and epiphytic fitness
MSRSALPAESKREVAKAQTRRGLLKSALQLYSREGAQGLSMNKVAKGAGIAQPSFYNHFERALLHE